MVLPIYQQRGHRSPMHGFPNPRMYPPQNMNRREVRAPGSNKMKDMLQRFVQPSAGAVGGNIGNRGVGGGLSQTLGNVQQVLKVVQSTAPMIQEYGPMVKNIPAMYRMMKAIKSEDSTEEETGNETRQDETAKKATTKETDVGDESIKKSGQSTPKLFI
jgi:hypothetical protein